MFYFFANSFTTVVFHNYILVCYLIFEGNSCRVCLILYRFRRSYNFLSYHAKNDSSFKIIEKKNFFFVAFFEYVQSFLFFFTQQAAISF